TRNGSRANHKGIEVRNDRFGRSGTRAVVVNPEAIRRTRSNQRVVRETSPALLGRTDHSDVVLELVGTTAGRGGTAGIKLEAVTGRLLDFTDVPLVANGVLIERCGDRVGPNVRERYVLGVGGLPAGLAGLRADKLRVT